MTNQEKYIFISYAHKDSHSVIPLIENMKKVGFHIWYDDGIEVGSEWPAYIQSSLEKSSVVMVFISKNSVESFNCRNEINFALMKHKTMIVVYLEETELKYGMGLQLNGIQALCMFKYAKASEFFEELTETSLLQICREGNEHLSPAFVDESEFGQGFSHQPETIVQATVSESSLLKRVEFFLEDGEWDKADEFCEQVLNYNPENAEAYFGKLLAELHIHRRQDLKNHSESFTQSHHYEKIIRFADDDLKKELDEYLEAIKSHNEFARLNAHYASIMQEMREAKTEKDFKEISEKFSAMGNFKNAAEMSRKAMEAGKDTIYEAAWQKQKSNNINDLKTAILLYRKIERWKDAEKQIKICQQRLDKIDKTNIYQTACQYKSTDTIESLEDAVKWFAQIPDFLDSKKQAEDCRKRIADLKSYLNKKKKRIKITAILVSCICIVLAVTILFTLAIVSITKSNKYDKALSLLNSGKYEQAISVFQELEGYKDSEAKIKQCQNTIAYNSAVSLMKKGNYKEAISLLKPLGSFENSEQKLAQCMEAQYNIALTLMNSGKYMEAISIFVELDNYKDCAEKITECNNAIKNKS